MARFRSSVSKTNGRLSPAVQEAPFGRLDGAADPLMQFLLRCGSDLARGNLAVLEQHQRWDRHDAVFGGRVRILVDVELDDLDLVTELTRDLFKRRRDHSAGAAPFRPEIHDHRFG